MGNQTGRIASKVLWSRARSIAESSADDGQSLESSAASSTSGHDGRPSKRFRTQGRDYWESFVGHRLLVPPPPPPSVSSSSPGATSSTNIDARDDEGKIAGRDGDGGRWWAVGEGEWFCVEVPEEVAFLLFSFLDLPALANAALVSKKWSKCCMDESLWRAQYDRIFGRHIPIFSLSPAEGSWRRMCKLVASLPVVGTRCDALWTPNAYYPGVISRVTQARKIEIDVGGIRSTFYISDLTCVLPAIRFKNKSDDMDGRSLGHSFEEMLRRHRKETALRKAKVVLLEELFRTINEAAVSEMTSVGDIALPDETAIIELQQRFVESMRRALASRLEHPIPATSLPSSSSTSGATTSSSTGTTSSTSIATEGSISTSSSTNPTRSTSSSEVEKLMKELRYIDWDKALPDPAAWQSIFTEPKEGAKVLAEWSGTGTYWPGVVKALLPQNNFDVAFNDGSAEEVPLANMYWMPEPSFCQPFLKAVLNVDENIVGIRVLVSQDGECWASGTIQAIGEPCFNYLVDFDDGCRKWVTADGLQNLQFEQLARLLFWRHAMEEGAPDHSLLGQLVIIFPPHTEGSSGPYTTGRVSDNPNVFCKVFKVFVPATDADGKTNEEVEGTMSNVYQYHITAEPYGSESWVARHNFMPFPKSAPIAAGDRVLVEFQKGTWYSSHVIEQLPNGNYQIDYDDGDIGEDIPADRIIHLPENLLPVGQPEFAPTATIKFERLHEDDDDDDEGVPATHRFAEDDDSGWEE